MSTLSAPPLQPSHRKLTLVMGAAFAACMAVTLLHPAFRRHLPTTRMPAPTAAQMVALLNAPCRALAKEGDRFTLRKQGQIFTAQVEATTAIGDRDPGLAVAIVVTDPVGHNNPGIYPVRPLARRHPLCRGATQPLNGQMLTLD